MNSIVFFLETKPGRLRAFDFFLWMMTKGVSVNYASLPVPKELNIDDYALYITDCEEAYEDLIKLGTSPLVLLYDPKEADRFPGARFFVMDIFRTEFSYFEKVYERIHNLPWTIATSNRLTLRETVEDDVDAFEEIYKDEEITRYTEALYDTETEKKYISEYREKVYACQNFGIWTVIENSSGKIIGRAGLSVRAGFEGVEVGFVIGKQYQNMGYGTEAVKLSLKFAQEEQLSPVYALVVEENLASVRLLSKCGFEKEENVTVNGVLYRRMVKKDNTTNSLFRIR